MSTSMTVSRPQGGLPTGDEFELIQRMSAMFAQSGLYPNIDNVAKAATIVQTGRELGIPPAAALRSFSFIKGKPSASAELLAALIYRDHGNDALIITESTNERCTIAYKRTTWNAPASLTFTIEDARTAKLIVKDGNWEKYPRAMLRSRAISEAARTAFQDSILGMYTPEEMGAEVTVDENGGVIADQPNEDSAPPPSREIDIETGEIVTPEPDASGDDPPTMATARDLIGRILSVEHITKTLGWLVKRADAGLLMPETLEMFVEQALAGLVSMDDIGDVTTWIVGEVSAQRLSDARGQWLMDALATRENAITASVAS